MPAGSRYIVWTGKSETQNDEYGGHNYYLRYLYLPRYIVGSQPAGMVLRDNFGAAFALSSTAPKSCPLLLVQLQFCKRWTYYQVVNAQLNLHVPPRSAADAWKPHLYLLTNPWSTSYRPGPFLHRFGLLRFASHSCHAVREFPGDHPPKHELTKGINNILAAPVAAWHYCGICVL